MNNLTPCPQCGNPMARKELMGLCPDCMLKAGLGSVADDTVAGQAARFVPPEVSEIAPLFPQLEVLEPLGCGGMGAVYKARQKNLDRFVALKILPAGIGSDPAFAARFSREAKALAKLNHPNIVTIHDFGQAGELFYFLMEYVDGVNLGQLLRSGRISSRAALAIVPQICDALQYAHDAGIVHRDIKPENILLDRKGRVKVADFGLAKLIGAAAGDGETGSAASARPSADDLTAGHLMGTPQYMAPEQVAHPSDVDHRADIYSLGVVFYQMLTGELPKGDFAAPSKKVVVDVRLDEVVLRAMEKRPELRYQQVSDVKTMCETIAQEGGLPKNRTPEPVALFASVERGRLLLALRAVITCAACVVFGLHLRPPVLGISLAAWGIVGAAIIGRILCGVRQNREEDRRALERAAMIGLIHAIGMLAAGLLLALINVGLNTEWNYFLAGLFAYGIVVAVIRLTKMVLSRRARGQEEPSTAPAPAHLADTHSEPRYSRTAIVGACFATLGLLMAAPVLLQPQVVPAWGGLFLLFGPATILGWIAVTQIRRSAGQLRGMGLAVFDGLLFPLLALDGVFAGVGKGLVRIFVEFNSNFSNLNNSHVHPAFITRLANLLSQHYELAPLIAVLIMLAVDVLVIRAVWRAVNRPVAAPPITENRLSAASASDSYQAMIASCFACVSAFCVGVAWRQLPHPPEVLMWAILGTALAAVGLAIPVRHSTRGKWALGFGAFQTALWVLCQLFFSLVTPLPETAPATHSFGPPFVAHLQQGTVELLALAPHPSTNAPSWHPDGSPSCERFPSLSGSDSAAGKVVKEIAFRLRTHDAGSLSYPVLRCDKDAEVSGMGSSLAGEGTNQNAVIYVQALACSPTARNVNVKFGVAEGSWETVFSTEKPRTNANGGSCGEQESDKTGLWEAHVQMTESKGGDVALAFNYSFKDDYETRIAYVNADGTAAPLRGNGSFGAGGLINGITSMSAADYAQINAFQLQRRRYEWVEFRNVSLQPGNKTAVETVNALGAETSPVASASGSPTKEAGQNESRSFGSVIECDVVEAIDFDTGKFTNSLPESVTRSSDIAQNVMDAVSWLEHEGMDGVSEPSGSLKGVGMKAKAVDKDAWEHITTEQIIASLKDVKRETWQDLDPNRKTDEARKTPVTWVFETREGGKGVLQVLGQSEHGVNVRYKLVQADSAAVEADSILAERPPVVVKTWPVSGARDVSPGETEIRVRFSKPMTKGSWSWCDAGSNSLPEFVGEPHYDADSHTCVLRAKLDAGRTYAIWLNGPTFKNFKDHSGHPAVPYLLIFQTKQK